jgi:hypothetical protein
VRHFLRLTSPEMGPTSKLKRGDASEEEGERPKHSPPSPIKSRLFAKSRPGEFWSQTCHKCRAKSTMSTPLGGATVMRNAIRTNELASFEKKPIALSLRLGMPPGAWRPGLEPAELSFRVPHFFHQTRRGTRGTIIIYYGEFPLATKNIWRGSAQVDSRLLR